MTGSNATGDGLPARRAGKRDGTNRHRLGSYLILPLFITISLVFAHSLLPAFTRAIPSTPKTFDPVLQAFILGWDWQTLPGGASRLFDAPIFYPEPRTLTYMDHMVGEAIAGAPVFAATHSIAAGYNFLLLLATIVSAWATYRLVRLFAVPRPGAWLCGFLFAFSPYRLANAYLLNQLQTQFIPLGLFFGVRYLMRWKLRDAVGMTCVIVAQVYFGWYYAFFLLTALALLAIYAAVAGESGPPRGHPVCLGLIATGSVLAVLPVSWPYILERFSVPEFHRTLGQTALYSADLLDYLRTNTRALASRVLPLPSGDQSYWPGTSTTILAVVGAWAIWKGSRPGGADRAADQSAGPGKLGALLGSTRERIRRLGLAGYFLVLAAVSFLLSLGPILHAGGARIMIPLPYALLYFFVPGYSSMRAPARFVALTTLALVVIGGYGYRVLRNRYALRSPAGWRAMATLLIAGSVALAWPDPASLFVLPSGTSLPGAYRWLADRPGTEPVAEFPVAVGPSDENARYALRQFYALYDRKPRVDGCSGFVSERYRSFRKAVSDFPTEAALGAVRNMGARLIVVHLADYPDSTRASQAGRLAAETRLLPLARFGSDRVYELRR